MNKLSYALWLSDALPTLGTVAGFLAFFTFVLCVGLLIATLICSFAEAREENVKTGGKACAKALAFAIPIYLLLQTTYIVMPSKSTIMMIAASEASSMVVSSPEAKEVLNDSLTVIRGWLKSQIKDSK